MRINKTKQTRNALRKIRKHAKIKIKIEINKSFLYHIY
uniref:Uncharacterized protein n=1 Tax=viral metagenome TaxID=1070528 RepID=A0A6C0EI51_9ZZZZ